MMITLRDLRTGKAGESHTRWGWGPLRGAFGPMGGHWRLFGFQRTWINQYDKAAQRSPSWSLDFFGWVYITHEPLRGTRWALGKISLSFKPGRHRIGLREAAQEIRRTRKRIDRALASARLTTAKREE